MILEALITFAQETGTADQFSNSTFVRTLMAILFWIGGFAAAPMIFMATMGIFRNIAGMSSSLSKGLRGKMMARGNEARARGMKMKNLDKNERKDIRALNRVRVNAAGSRLSADGRNRRAAVRQQLNQSNADAMDKDSMYTFAGDGELNRLVAISTDKNDMYQRALKAKDAKRENDPNNWLYKKYYDEDGQLKTKQLEQDISRVESMRNKYGTQALREISHKNAISGKGYKASEYEQIWQDAGRIAAGDGHALASIVGRGKSAATNAGFGVAGGASFGTTMELATANLADSEKRQEITNKYLDNVIDSAGPGTLFHSSMSNESLEVVSRHMTKRVMDKHQKMLNASPQEKAKAEIDYNRELANVANAYEHLRGLGSAKGNIVANELLGITLVDTSGKTPTHTIRQAVESARGSGNRAFLNKRQELTARERDNNDAAAAAAAARDAAGGNLPGLGN